MHAPAAVPAKANANLLYSDVLYTLSSRMRFDLQLRIRVPCRLMPAHYLAAETKC